MEHDPPDQWQIVARPWLLCCAALLAVAFSSAEGAAAVAVQAAPKGVALTSVDWSASGALVWCATAAGAVLVVDVGASTLAPAATTAGGASSGRRRARRGVRRSPTRVPRLVCRSS